MLFFSWLDRDPWLHAHAKDERTRASFDGQDLCGTLKLNGSRCVAAAKINPSLLDKNPLLGHEKKQH